MQTVKDGLVLLVGVVLISLKLLTNWLASHNAILIHECNHNMEPGIHLNDILLCVREVKLEQLKRGDVVAAEVNGRLAVDPLLGLPGDELFSVIMCTSSWTTGPFQPTAGTSDLCRLRTCCAG